MKKWLILDSNYLCHRAFYAMGGLSNGEVLTGVVFGFMRDIVSLQDFHQTDNIIFCFDYGRSKRAIDYPEYKANRYESIVNGEQADKMEELLAQIKALRLDYLRSVGFNNVFFEKGFEADDLIAQLCADIKEDEIVIVSSDKDLYQLLSPRVSMHNPHKKTTITVQDFKKEWLISPIQWVDVKALAGCNTDNVKGIKGVGEKTAAKFLTGHLKPGSKAFKSIVENNKIWRRNRGIVRLPYPGTPSVKLESDCVTRAKWVALCERLGMSSLQSQPPISSRTSRKQIHGGNVDGTKRKRRPDST